MHSFEISIAPITLRRGDVILSTENGLRGSTVAEPPRWASGSGKSMILVPLTGEIRSTGQIDRVRRPIVVRRETGATHGWAEHLLHGQETEFGKVDTIDVVESNSAVLNVTFSKGNGFTYTVRMNRHAPVALVDEPEPEPEPEREKRPSSWFKSVGPIEFKMENVKLEPEFVKMLMGFNPATRPVVNPPAGELREGDVTPLGCVFKAAPDGNFVTVELWPATSKNLEEQWVRTVRLRKEARLVPVVGLVVSRPDHSTLQRVRMWTSDLARGQRNLVKTESERGNHQSAATAQIKALAFEKVLARLNKVLDA